MGDRIRKILDEIREREVRDWTEALASAERAAERNPDRIQRTYQVNYRVEPTITDDGSERDRREALVQLLRSLKGEQHTATSTWIIKMYIPQAEEIVKLLAGPLTLQWDYINVSEVLPDNSHHLGDAKLQS